MRKRPTKHYTVQKHIVIPVDGKTECIVIKIVLSLYVSKFVAFSVPIRHKDITCNEMNRALGHLCAHIG